MSPGVPPTRAVILAGGRGTRMQRPDAAASLSAARPELESGGDPVLSAHHVRDAVAALDEMIGLVPPDEVLGRVFERFCVGK